MLIVREEQKRIFEIEGRSRLVIDIATWLRLSRAAQLSDIPDVSLHERVRLGLAEAEQLGLTDVPAIEVFVKLLFDIHSGYHHHPEVAKILNNPILADRDRIRCLLAWISRADLHIEAIHFQPGLW